MPTKTHPYYVVWSGALNMGDTPGTFMDAQFVGLLLQIPITITFLPSTSDPVRILLKTTEVEVFIGKKHPVLWDWMPGLPLSAPIGYIDDTSTIPGRPEYHALLIDKALAAEGPHSITIHVNAEIAAGMRDDFVLKRIEAHET